jgi:elongation factor P
MRNVRTGKLAENRFRAGEALDFVRVETKEFQFLYKEGDNYVLMENETYDQVYVDGVLFGDGEKFLKEGMNVTVSFDNTTPIAAEIPSSVELEVTYTEPGLQGDTATKTLKPATLETGAEIKVPLFVNIGEKIRVDTRTREYIERVK